MADNDRGRKPEDDPMFGAVVRGSQAAHQRQLKELERQRQQAEADRKKS